MAQFNAKLDHKKLSLALFRLRDTLGYELGEVILKDEMIQTIKSAIRLENKMTLQGGARLGTTARAVREKVVRYEVMKTMSPLTPENLTNTKFREAIMALIRQGDDDETQAFFDRIKKGRFRGVRVVGFSKSFHRTNINQKTGRARSTRYVIARPYDVVRLNTYIAETQQHVGWKHAGFSTAAANLGFKLPSWVARHGAAPGSFNASFANSGVSSVEAVSSAFVNADNFQEHLLNVLALRQRALETKLSRIIKGEAVNLGFAVRDKTGMLTMKNARLDLSKAKQEPTE